MLLASAYRQEIVKVPAFDMASTQDSWGVSGTYLNGGGFVRRSQLSHTTYNMSWNLTGRAEIQRILNVLDTPGPYYFANPMAVDTNMLPPLWASPYLTVGSNTGLAKVTATEIPTPNNTLSLPHAGVQLVLGANTERTVLKLANPMWGRPLPERAWIGWTARSIEGNVSLQVGVKTVPSYGGTFPSPVSFRRDTFISAADGPIFEVSLTGNGTIQIWDMVFTTRSDLVSSGPYMRGMGNSGVEVIPNSIHLSNYSAALDLQGLSVGFKEVGSWL